MSRSPRDPRLGDARSVPSARSARSRCLLSQRATHVALLLAALPIAAGAAYAQSAASAALPGSPRPPGVGLSPEAPHAGSAAGGCAPSCGAPVKKDAWAVTLGGSIFA